MWRRPVCLFRLLNSQFNHATSQQRTSVISHLTCQVYFIVPKLECSPLPITGSLFPAANHSPAFCCDQSCVALRYTDQSEAPPHRAAAELCWRAATQHRFQQVLNQLSTNFPCLENLQQSGMSRRPYWGQPPLLLTTHETLTIQILALY